MGDNMMTTPKPADLSESKAAQGLRPRNSGLTSEQNFVIAEKMLAALKREWDGGEPMTRAELRGEFGADTEASRLYTEIKACFSDLEDITLPKDRQSLLNIRATLVDVGNRLSIDFSNPEADAGMLLYIQNPLRTASQENVHVAIEAVSPKFAELLDELLQRNAAALEYLEKNHPEEFIRAKLERDARVQTKK